MSCATGPPATGLMVSTARAAEVKPGADLLGGLVDGVVDALRWEGADDTVIELLGDHPDAAQYLLRAAIFRLVMDQLCNPRRRTPPRWWPQALRLTADLCRLAEKGWHQQ